MEKSSEKLGIVWKIKFIFYRFSNKNEGKKMSLINVVATNGK